MNKSIIKFKTMEIGKTYETHALLLGVNEKIAKNASYYVELSLSDGDAIIMARKFNCDKEELENLGVTTEDIVRVCICVGMFNGSKSYNVTLISRQTDQSLQINDFLICAPIDTEKAFDELIGLIGSSHVDSCSDFLYSSIDMLTIGLLNDNRESFMAASAAKTIHHNMIGGLLCHTLTMAKQAVKTLETYPTLDRELLICGTALHDIGKLKEMRTSCVGQTDYTPEGRLLGHSTIGVMMVKDAAGKSDYDPERVLLLQHMIAAHHGLSEYGAITSPAIPEAMVLHALDMMDSKVYVYNDAYESLSAGTLSESIYGLNGKCVFRPSS